MAAGAAAAAGSHTLLDTPTWAVAAVCFVLISISIAIEHSIHLLERWLKKHQKKALSDAVEKLKSELILVGFISLLLTISQRPILDICISTELADTMLPCQQKPTDKKITAYENYRNIGTFHRRLKEDKIAVDNGPCGLKGKVSLISQDGLQQLHKFIFLLALVHVVFSVLTMALGRAKMKRWKSWEKETQTTDYQVANDPNRFRFIRQTTFGRRHMNIWMESSLYLWIKCFFRQFFNSVAKVDYLTLRHGFIATHRSPATFNFQNYIKRSLEDDFKVVVGISPHLWLIMVIILLCDVHGWNIYLWLSFVPLVIVLLLGAKLEVIVTRMAIRLQNKSTVIKGAPLVQPNDELFWFGRPRLLLHFIHLTIFLNAFELAFFIWTTWLFGLKSCYHEKNYELTITRVLLAVTVQILYSYITLPLYALITQMGSQYKRSILEEQTTKALTNWLKEAKENRRKERKKHKQEQSHGHSRSPSPSPRTTHYVEDCTTLTSSNNQVSSPHLCHSPTLALPNNIFYQDIVEEVVEPPCSDTFNMSDRPVR